MSKHADLIARLKAVDVGSKAFDAEIHVAVADDPNTYVVEPHPDSMFSHKPGWYRTGNDLSVLADAVTTSLDAALSLAKRVHADWMVSLTLGLGMTVASYRSGSIINPDTVEFTGTSKTPALALCIAILKALEAKA